MNIIENKNRYRLVQAANGEIPCDLSIENVQLVNVLTEEIYMANVDILDGIIVRVREPDEKLLLESISYVDGKGKYLLPGFIDMHMHVESSMLIPENFGYAAIGWGTTTAITDPHEIANVLGVTGIKFMLGSARRSPLRIFTLIPSCVPAAPQVEGAGSIITSDDVKTLLKEPDILGIAEVMDYLGVINNTDRMRSIIDEGLAAHSYIQGHAPFVMGKALDAYLCGGPKSDHEMRLSNEIHEKLRKGMHVNIKSSSLSDTVQEFLDGVKSIPNHELVSFCTDDIHAADLLDTGHINRIAAACVKGGFNPIEVVKMGTLNAAHEIGFEDIGAIAPGYVADLQLVNDLEFKHPPERVYVAGKLKALNGICYETPDTENYYAFKPLNSIHITHITSPEVFKIETKPHQKHLIFDTAREHMTPNQEIVYEELPEQNGYIDLTNKEEYQYLTVINRHGAETMTKVVCSNFNLKRGCIASTISHDSHNMTIVYKDPEDAYVAAKELERVGGGICVVMHHNVICTLPLPVAGLMSMQPAVEVATQIELVNRYVEYLCDSDNSMLLSIAILALPVRPGIIITDKGIIRGDTLEFIPQIIEGD